MLCRIDPLLRWYVRKRDSHRLTQIRRIKMEGNGNFSALWNNLYTIDPKNVWKWWWRLLSHSPSLSHNDGFDKTFPQLCTQATTVVYIPILLIWCKHISGSDVITDGCRTHVIPKQKHWCKHLNKSFISTIVQKKIGPVILATPADEIFRHWFFISVLSSIDIWQYLLSSEA